MATSMAASTSYNRAKVSPTHCPPKVEHAVIVTTAPEQADMKHGTVLIVELEVIDAVNTGQKNPEGDMVGVIESAGLLVDGTTDGCNEIDGEAKAFVTLNWPLQLR
jgi:hypothetical protein